MTKRRRPGDSSRPPVSRISLEISFERDKSGVCAPRDEVYLMYRMRNTVPRGECLFGGVAVGQIYR